MLLNISYVKPCGEKNTLAARVDIDRLDTDKIRKEFGSTHSGIGVEKLTVENAEVLVFSDHLDIRNAESESHILRIVGRLRPFTKTS